MKRILTAVITIVASSSLTFAVAQQSAQSPEQEIRQTYSQLVEAGKQGNSAAFKRYVADDVLFTGFGPTIETKADVVKGLSHTLPEGEKKMIKNRRVVEVKVQGPTAVLVERVWRSDGKQVNVKLNITNVFAIRNQKWQLVASSLSTD